MGANAAALGRRALAVALVAFAATTIHAALATKSGPAAGRPADALGRGAQPARAAASASGPNDPFYGAAAYRWVFSQTGLARTWQQTTGTPAVVIAVVDTGVDASAPDLSGGVLPGRDVSASGAPTTDAVGHGTAVASVLAARTNNGIGIAGACGRCSILPIRITGADGLAPVDAIAAGIAAAADAGARIVNVSFAAPSSSPALAAAVAHAQALGALVVAAAGNDGRTGAAYPAALPGVVSVEAADQSGRPYSFSNRGSSVALAAPGCAIVAERDTTYASECGTSIAAPLVAGAAGLLASAVPGATAAQLAAALEQGAARVGDTAYGRLDAAASLRLLAGATTRR
jgi:thermitase